MAGSVALPALGQPFVEVAQSAGLVLPQRVGLWEGDCSGGLLSCLGVFTGGVAVGDLNGDGYPDLVFTRPNATTLVYINAHDGTFVDHTADHGFGVVPGANGVALADLDNDGDPDVIITVLGWGHHRVFENRWPEPWVDVPGSAGLRAGSALLLRSGFGLGLGDFDRDGSVDVFATEWIGPTACGRSHARLYQNTGAGGIAFTDVTERAGVTLERADNPFAWSFGAGFTDFDEDGWPDLLVTSDARTSRLFFGGPGGEFTDHTRTSGVATEFNGMGSTVADFDGDGRLDLFVSAITPERSNPTGGHRLYLYAGERRFLDATDAGQVRFGGWGWGVAALDGDHDGDQDMAMVTGLPSPSSAVDPIRYWQNQGDATFEEIAQDVGLLDTEPGMGLAVLDYDVDGDQDIVIVRNGRTPLLYRNDGGVALGEYLRVRARGTRGNRDALGAVVRVTVDGRERVAEIASVSHFLGQSERVAHFGLGTSPATRTARVHVRFLGGHEVTMEGVALNQEVLVTEPDLPFPSPPSVVPATPRDCNGDGEADACAVDCDENGSPDSCDVETGAVPDCNGNGVPDSCEIRSHFVTDCDENGVPDVCDVDVQPARDCDDDALLDVCEIALRPWLDCNADGVLDVCRGTTCTGVDGGIRDMGTGAPDAGSVGDAGMARDAATMMDTGSAADAARTDAGTGTLRGQGCAAGLAEGPGDARGVLLLVAATALRRRRRKARAARGRGRAQTCGARSSELLHDSRT
ncbi:MAG: CRTAC1 family protein [Sandaracinaceae bacterium]|nr:CRTAC1 family protein [Sandaracinaceae bacterium]